MSTGPASTVHFLGVLLLLLAAKTMAASPTPRYQSDLRYSNSHTLVMGVVSNNPKSDFRAMRPLADYVAERLRPFGVRSVVIRTTSNRHQMVKQLLDGNIDWISESPYTAVALEELTGARIVLRRWQDGAATSRGVLFARADSPLQSLDDLQGRTIAFESPVSTAAYFQPASDLIEKGLLLARLATPREAPPLDAVGYLFAGRIDNVFTWVHKGLADAGVVSDYAWRTTDTPASYLTDLRVIYETRELPRSLELVRADLPDSLIEPLSEVLVSAHTDPASAAALSAYGATARFEPLRAADRRALENVRAMLQHLPAQLD